MSRSPILPAEATNLTHPEKRGRPSLGVIRWSWLWSWHERWRQRRILEEMEAHRLKDIGLSRAQARYEAAKPFWRP